MDKLYLKFLGKIRNYMYFCKQISSYRQKLVCVILIIT